MIPQPDNYETADAWLAALETYGRSIGAKPMDALGLGRLVARGEVATFWDSIVDFGRQTPNMRGLSSDDQVTYAIDHNLTIEGQLRAFFAQRKE